MSKNRERFLNPYYFISLPEQKQEADKGEEKLTGKITYTITTKTPIFIPNTSCDEAFDIKIPSKEIENSENDKHKSYDFYSYAELKKGEAETTVKEPVIPGSEVRGMFRSVYEAVTGSCMSIINDEAMISNRTSPNPKQVYKPYLLVRNGGRIYLEEANVTYMEKELAKKLEDGKKYFFRTKEKDMYIGRDRKRMTRYLVDGELSLKEIPSKRKSGYLMKGEIEPKGTKSTTKKYVVLFSKKKFNFRQQHQIRFDEELQNQMENILFIYENDSKSYIEYAKRYHDFINGNGEDCFPIYARNLLIDEENIIQVSPAAITKQVYTKKVRDLVDEELRPCTKLDSICPACSLFGMVNSKKKESEGLKCKASKIRFSDMTLKNRNVDFSTLFLETITIEELASPKISNAQMYLIDPMDIMDSNLEVKEWNYDYWIDRYGKAHYYEAKINGRKFYWHHPEFMLHRAEVTKRNVTIRPLGEGKSFIGNIYFDGITKRQLEQLVYLCDISRTEEYGYKIGMGKPLGMGSIAVKVDSITFRKFDINKDELYVEDEINFKDEAEREEYLNRYRYGYVDVGFLDGKIRKEFEMLMKFSTANNVTISYPYTLQQVDEESMSEGFQWFVMNKHSRNLKLQILKNERKKIGKLPYLEVLDEEKIKGKPRNYNKK